MEEVKYNTYKTSKNIILVESIYSAGRSRFQLTHGYNGTLYPDSKFHGANMGPTWVLLAPDEPHDGPMDLAISG